MLLLASSACDNDEDFSHLGRAWPTSDQAVTPSEYGGNFVASDDDQVCYELDRLLGAMVTEEMKGFKIDPPVNTTHPAITITVEQPTLSFITSADYQPVGMIVKGADAHSVYDYRAAAITEDAHLRAPYKNDKIPTISHYNVCYMRAAVVTGEQGCTPGYWRNHLDRWAGVAPSDDFDAVFRTNAFSPNITMAIAVNLEGGGANALARHAIAALLNAYGGVGNLDDGATVAYPLPAARVIALVRGALASGDAAEIETVKDTLDAHNQLGCPLHGTPST